MKTTRLSLSALLGGFTLAALSCGDPSPLGVGSGGLAPAGDLLDPVTLTDPITQSVGLLACSPLAADSATRSIGSEGGTLQVGPHTLVVPPGALADSVSITAVAPADSVNRVTLQPEGLTFAEAASLTMSYANCDGLSSTLPKQIAYLTDALAIIEYLVSLDDVESRTVTGRLEHFSTYAVAW